MRLTVRHRFHFGDDRELVGADLVGPEAWDALRIQTTGAFALPETREQWECVADEHPELQARAHRIDGILEERGVRRLASYGVGGATLECWLHRLRPQRELILGDYAPATVERLARIFGEAQCVRHDLLNDPPLEADWHLFHRIDTELANRPWRHVMRRFSDRSILFVAGGMVDVPGAVAEMRKALRVGSTRAGWARTRRAMKALWQLTHRAEPADVGGLPAWVLTPKSSAR